jgi:hypothetical protein
VEVHRAREKLMADCNYEIDAFFDGVMKREAASGVKLVPAKQRSDADEVANTGSSSLPAEVVPVA